MTKEEVTKIWWELTTEWERMKGQIKEQFDEKMADIRKRELDSMSEAMAMILERGEKTLELLDRHSSTVSEAILKIADHLVKLRDRLDEVEALIVKRLDR